MRHPGSLILSAFVERLTARSDLRAEERRALLDLPFHVERLEGGREFVRMGDRSDHLAVVGEGLVARFHQTSDGRRQTTAFHVPGDAANLASAVDLSAGAALQALTRTTILKIPQDAVRAVASRHPAIAEAFWRDAVADASILAQWVINLGIRDSKACVAHLICEMAVRHRPKGADHADNFPFPVTQGQLAEATGITSVHVNRTLQALKPIFTARGGTVEILDWDHCVRIAGFDPTYLLLDVPAADRVRIAR